MVAGGGHPSADELARVAVGAFGRRKAALIETHVAGCAVCGQLLQQIYRMPGLLRTVSYPPVPQQVMSRLERALGFEAGRRAEIARREGSGVRCQGAVDSAASLGVFDHLFWLYPSKAAFAEHALEYAADGIAAGQYVEFVGDDSTADLRSQLARAVRSMPVGRAPGAGEAAVDDIADYYQYASDGVVDPDATAAALHAAIDDALAAGFTGLRTVVDATPLARTRTQREAAAREEHLVDRAVNSQRTSAMCGYSVQQIGRRAAAEMACMHPFISQGAAPFRLFAEEGADFALAGRIDARAVALFRKTLQRIGPPVGNELIVDARQTEAIDDQALAALEAHAARTGRNAILRTSRSNSPSPASLSSLPRLTVNARS
jgi:hypothetical protein